MNTNIHVEEGYCTYCTSSKDNLLGEVSLLSHVIQRTSGAVISTHTRVMMFKLRSGLVDEYLYVHSDWLATICTSILIGGGFCHVPNSGILYSN